ncbi:hypothetical protein [Pedobacter frigoris]|uniref:hypothetical protein n=1 Tax=Pedobacter frigoris TaxID=2571272 RepID=UPI00197E2488|nr:hypothetical protein [Pedobacter frigoris]
MTKKVSGKSVVNLEKGHEELQLIMKTVMAKFTDETTLLIQGVKGKFDEQGSITDIETHKRLDYFINAFTNLVNKKPLATILKTSN